MPDKTIYFEQIKKIMGWCPLCNKVALQTKQSCTSVNMAPISGKTGLFQEFQTSNVVFPANYAILLLYFIISLRLILFLRSPEYISPFLVFLLLLNVSCYWLLLKTFDATVLVDKLGVHLQGFKLKELEISYNEIKCVTSHGHEKSSKKESLFLVIVGIVFCGLLLVGMAEEGDWSTFLLFISLFLLILIMERKHKTRFENLNTQLYIRMKHKKWYEWTSHYSLITDEASAAEIKTFIETHCKELCNAKTHEVIRHANLEDFDTDVPGQYKGDNRYLKNPGWLQRVSAQTLLFCVFLTCVNLLIYRREGLEPDHLLTAFLTGLFMVLFEFIFRWNKQVQRYDTIAKKSIVYPISRIKSFRDLMVIIEVLFKISLLFLFSLVLIPYIFNLSTPPISGAFAILLCPAWGYYFRLVYWEKKNHMKFYTKYENNFEKKYAFVKMYAVKEKKGEL